MTNSPNRAAAPSDSLLGLNLDEYRLEELLGQGGMARVYRAVDIKLLRYAAVKIIDAPYRRDAEYIRRFEREAQAIAKLEHPNVVRLYRYGQVNLADDSAADPKNALPPLLYMAMQYVQGKDLGYVLDSCRLDGEFVNPEDGLQVIQQVCQALDYVHAQGIIHRDIKPSNIMLSRDDGHAVLTDFGLALMTQMGTRGETFGSPHYIAPEQAVSSAKAVPQSDLYAVGVILFELFTGTLPFNAPDPLDVALLHMSAPPPAPRDIRPELSEEVEKVILKAMEKEPEDRYQTGRALAEALEHALHGKPEAPRPSRKTVLDRVSIGFAASPLPPIPAAVIPAPLKPEQEPETPPSKEPGEGEISRQPLIPPPAAPDVASAREIQPTIRLFDAALPEAVTADAARPAPAASKAVDPASQTPARATAAIAPGSAQPQGFAAQPAVAETLPPPAHAAGMRRWLWIAGGILVVVLLGFLCVGSAAALIFSRMASQSAVPTQVSGSDSGLAEPTGASPTQAASPQETPAALPIVATPTLAAPKTYPILIGRCRDEGCVVVKNTGKYPLALAGLKLSSKNGAIQGSEWGIELLLPGNCVRAVKDEDWLNRLPDGVSCDVAGHNLTREGKERFWKDTFQVEYAGNKLGECRKDNGACTFEIQR